MNCKSCPHSFHSYCFFQMATHTHYSATDDVNIDAIKPLMPPGCLLDDMPISESIEQHVLACREEVSKVVRGEDDRLIVVVGPCSVHDTKAALEYARWLKPIREELIDHLVIVMRVYFEKPRTTVGWKGLINDPNLNGSFQINVGLRVARQLLIDINDIGVPAGCEFLDTISPQYICDLVSWGAIGARTTESQCHRELASGISCAVGFKNGTSGDVQVAVDGVRAAQHPHSFLSVTKDGIAAIVKTKGNESCHVILRGGKDGTNYQEEKIKGATALLGKVHLPAQVMVDCSHGNSNKDHTRQPLVAQSIAEQIASGSRGIMGVMIESNLKEGNQKLPPNPLSNANGTQGAKRKGPATYDPSAVLSQLEFGKSVTDACINLDTTRDVLVLLAQAVAKRRAKSS
eukprot:m.63560 g.63560  ORF g.63560 m.63560 type:complete len:402 (+) comp19471_c0_seq1:71-1276(+)